MSSNRDNREMDLIRQGAEADDVRLVRYAEAWPVEGSKAGAPGPGPLMS